MQEKIINFLKDKRVAIVGYGREGKSTYNFLRKYLKDQLFTIVDNNKDLLNNNEELKNDKNLEFVLGENALENLEIYDCIIKAPGVKFKDLDISKFKDKITSQLGLTLDFYRENVIGITGTKGKSTTTSLIYEVLKNQGKKAYLVGNIGIPIFNYIDEYDENSILVTEIGAPQLEFVKNSPHISLILNLFEEHLDFFGTKEKYFETKMKVFNYQNSNDYGLYFGSNETLKQYTEKGNYKSKLIDISKEIKVDNTDVYYNGKKVYNIENERYILGEHNLHNIFFVLAISELLHLNLEETLKTIKNFKGLEHRMEYVGLYNGVKYYNDSIATIPDACMNAINTLNPSILIFGGMDRGIDYSSLIKYFNESNIESFICMPETGTKIGKEIKNKNVYFVDTLEEAVQITKEIGKGVCLMSPAAPSYNAFKNFEEKGRKYKEIVKEG